MRERRRSIRHKIHSPAYTSMNGNLTGTVLDLNGIIDLSEEGMCFQSSTQREANENFDLYLDLSETKGYIPVRGRVVWSEPSGLTGLYFPTMASESLDRLREWLFINTIVAHANSSSDQQAHSLEQRAPEDPALSLPIAPEAQLLPDYTSVLTAAAAVKREVESLGSDVDAVLQLVAERALVFTRATGAAIALAGAEGMICRATKGPDAPGLGARLNSSSGFSGECVRTGRLIHCEDSETDPRVDRESCRALGVRSLMAAPIRSSDTVIGLIEVFSPLPDAFTPADGVGLRRLAEIVLAALHRAIQSMTNGHSEAAIMPVEPPTSDVSSSAPPKIFATRRNYILAIAAAVLVLSAIFLVPRIWDAPRTSAQPPVASSATGNTPAPKPVAIRVTSAQALADLRRLAESGDPMAQFNLGARYALGEDVKLDYAQAARWFTLAAEQGHVVAQSNLGAYYWAGTGVPKDLRKAYFWTVLAQTGGDEASRMRVSYLASSMNRREILTVQQQADDWLRQHHYLGQAPHDSPYTNH